MSLDDTIEKIIDQTAKYFTPGGCQTQIIIENQSSHSLELAGTAVGAGDPISRNGRSYAPPPSVKSKDVGVILIDSDWGSSQVCAEYGFQIDGERYHLALFYAYNPKLDSHMYAGLRNPVSRGGAVSRDEWRKARRNEGPYAGNEICADATEGSGPDWQKDVTKLPVHRYSVGPIEVELSCTRKNADGGSRLVAQFSLTDS